MGIRNLLSTQGSPLSYNNGATPRINSLAGQQSKLHADGNAPGYSLDGTDFSQVNAAYQAYHDGTSNPLPMPSLLDLNGITPSKYVDNLPG